MIWDGITQPNSIPPGELKQRNQLAEYAKSFSWPKVFTILEHHPNWVNCSRPGSNSWFTPLHQAAYAGASIDIVRRLIALGAWRTLRNAEGKRAIDIAREKGHRHLIEFLEPALNRNLPAGYLARMQIHFHDVIRTCVGDVIRNYELRMPELEPLLEFAPLKIEFPLPGQYGEISYGLQENGMYTLLFTWGLTRTLSGNQAAWCYVISPNGSLLVNGA